MKIRKEITLMDCVALLGIIAIVASMMPFQHISNIGTLTLYFVVVPAAVAVLLLAIGFHFYTKSRHPKD